MSPRFEPETWPLPRFNRITGGGVAQEAAPPAPRMRWFNWSINYVALTRRSWSTPRLTGPCIVKGFNFYTNFTADPPSTTFEIGWSRVPVQEDDVAVTTARPYTLLMERLNPDSIQTAASGEGVQWGSMPNTFVRWLYEGNLIVSEPEVYIVMALQNNSGLAANLTGQLSVLEGVDPYALASFL